MKKHIIAVSIITLLIGVSNVTKCQSLSQIEMDRYWHYRERLTTSFVYIGMGDAPNLYGNNTTPGQSIPMAIRNLTETGVAFWGDNGRQIGYYIGMLATEYKLLANAHQNTNETVMELFYALHAVFRLDSLAIYWWNYGGQPFNSAITDGNPASFPGYGYVMFTDETGAGLPPDANIEPTDPFKAIYSGSTIESYMGSGLVGPITATNGDDDQFLTDMRTIGAQYNALTTENLTSKDNYLAILMGLTIAVKCLPSNVNFFMDQNGDPQDISKTYGDLLTMAQGLGHAELQYIFNSNFKLKFPDGSQVIGQSADRYDLSYFQVPLEEIANNFFGFSNATCPLCPIYVFDGIYSSQTLCYINGLNNSINAVEIAIELAAMSNNGAGYGDNLGGAQECISILGSYPANTGLFSSYKCILSPAFPNQEGWDQFYGAIHELLYPDASNFNDLDLCAMESILSSAPDDGPYRHDYTGNDDAPGWNNRRFIDPPDPTSGGGFQGNLNGLDYMLFYNLHCLVSTEPMPAVSIPSEFSTKWPNLLSGVFIGDIGDQALPLTINRCNDFNIGTLAVYGPGVIEPLAGDLNLVSGNGYFIDLKPIPGSTIHIYDGAYFDASCILGCCTAPNTYGPSTVDLTTYQLRPIRSSNDTTTYKKTSEFDNPSYNAIMNYPNPFSSQTTVEFQVKESSVVNIYIYNINGQKISEIVSNVHYSKGSYAISYNASSLPAGSYNCELLTQDDKKTTKLIKTK